MSATPTPGHTGTRAAREIQEGWHVLTGPPHAKRWRRVKAVTEIVNLATMRTTGQLRAKIRIEFDQGASVTVAPDEQFDCRWPDGH